MKHIDVMEPGGVVTGSQDDPIFQRVCDLLEPYNRKGIALTRATGIVADIEVDSVAVFDLIMEVEDVYDVIFPMETVGEMRTIGDLVDTIGGLRVS
ncbi:MAG: phosphopantetheine-binding protein [Pseudomonadota bacterium]